MINFVESLRVQYEGNEWLFFRIVGSYPLDFLYSYLTLGFRNTVFKNV